MVASLSSYKDQPMIQLGSSADDRFPFTFGLKKAKMIVEHFDAIKRFAETDGKSCGATNGRKVVKKASE